MADKDKNKEQDTEFTRDSFVFYRSFFEATRLLPPENKAEIFDAICVYALNQIQIEMTNIPKAMFSLIKPQLDANYKKWLTGVKNGAKGSKHGSKGGRPPNKSKEKPTKYTHKTPNKPLVNPQVTPTKPSNVNDNDNVNDNVNGNGNGNENVFARPPFEKIKKEFIKYDLPESTVKFETKKFFEHYEACQWETKNGKMENLQGAVQNWISNLKEFEIKLGEKKEAKTTFNDPRLATVSN